MDMSAQLASLLGGPAASVAIVWWLIAKAMPRRDELFTQALRDITAEHKEAVRDLGGRIDHQTARIDRFGESMALPPAAE